MLENERHTKWYYLKHQYEPKIKIKFSFYTVLAAPTDRHSREYCEGGGRWFLNCASENMAAHV